MGLWGKSVVIFNSIRQHGKQSIRSLADRTGSFQKQRASPSPGRRSPRSRPGVLILGNAHKVAPGSSVWSWPRCLSSASNEGWGPRPSATFSAVYAWRVMSGARPSALRRVHAHIGVPRFGNDRRVGTTRHCPWRDTPGHRLGG